MTYFLKRLPRHLVFATDLLLCLVSLLVAYLLRFNFDLDNYIWQSVPYVIPIVLLLKATAFYSFRTYAGILKYSSIEDLKRIFFALTVCAFLLLCAQLINNRVYGNQNFIPISVIFIDYIASLASLSALRVMAKILHYEWQHSDSQKVKVAVFGAAEVGTLAQQALLEEAEVHYKITAFLDDDARKAGKMINGVRILKPGQDLAEQLRDLHLDLLVLASPKMPLWRKKQIVEASLSAGVQVLVVPPVYKWINGQLSFKQLREVQIEDVLGRESIQIETSLIQKELSDKVILITGAAGSIGSELARQIIAFKPKQLVLLDQAESPLYELELELTEMYFKVNFETVLGDVRNGERMEAIFNIYKPEIVFHAAAYKHVPVIEDNPSESLLTNIWGTKIVADLAVKYRAQKFVLLSTDKAVNPTSVMGASKRISEIYTQSLGNYLKDAAESHTRFITTRFGNVLGSTGSVIPRFRKQIAEGGPVTVTHPDISRYFMTIQEACQLVLDAAAMGKGGEIYLFDMGDSMKIVELAKKMIRLSGLTLGKDIQLVFTGLRPGEKLEEELFHKDENVQPTHHPKIMIANVPQYDYGPVRHALEELVQLFRKQDNDAIIIKMKQMVPEYISRNSVYEKYNLPQ